LCEDSLKTGPGEWWEARDLAASGHDVVMERMPDTPAGASMGYRALVVDDEVPLAGVIADYLEREHFDVSVAHNGHDAIAMAREIDPDVVVLDVALPGIDGLEACRQLRTFSDAYVVMLTARDTEMDTVVGLSVGADDYVTKPFSPRELVARIRAMLRRPRKVSNGDSLDASPSQPPPRVFGALSIDVAGRQVFIDDRPIRLTRTEFDVLAALSARPGVVFSRRQLLDSVWAESWVGNEHLVDVHVGHLRRKLGDDPADPRYVVTVRGVGYRMGTGQ
jgi:DNA-binding response OmpR family regulator